MAIVVRWDVRKVVTHRTEYRIETPARAHEIRQMLDAAESGAGAGLGMDCGEVLIESTPEAIVVVVQRTEVLSGSFRSTDR